MSGAPQILSDSAVALSQTKRSWIAGSNAVLIAASAAGCLVFVTSAVVPVALPAIGLDLRLSPSELQWLINAELLPLSALTLIAGALGDRYGQKRILVLGIALFGAGVLWLSLATSWLGLVLARFTQGLAEALILPSSLSVLGQAFPADLRARAIGFWSAAAAVACAIAPAIAGALLDAGSWRWVFGMLGPLIIVALGLATAYIPNHAPTRGEPIDLAGGLTSTLMLAGFGIALTRLTSGAGLDAPATIASGVGFASLAALVVVERRRGDRAMLPPALLASRSIVGSSLYTALLYGPFAVVLTLIPYVMIRGAHLSTTLTGLAFIPLQVSITIVSPWAGALCRRFGRRSPLILGAVVVALSCVAALRIGEGATYWRDIFPAVLLLAFGMSLAIAPLTTLVLTSVELDRAGTAAGVNGATSRAGSLLAVALLGGVLEQDGAALFVEFRAAMIASALACVAAAISVLIIEPGPHLDFFPRA